jgi:uncharacterized protein YggE
MTRSSVVVIVVALAVTGASRPARAQYFSAAGDGNFSGFAVTGKGMASAKPNRLEIDIEVSASSELTADAIVKYRDAKKRLEEAFAALRLAQVTVEERGLLVDQKGMQMSPYFFDSQPNRRNKTEVQLTRKLMIKCSDIRKLDEEALLQLVARLLDVAQDAGGKVGPTQDPYAYYYYGRMNQQNGLVRFILDDFDKLEEEAYGKAIADAESQAQRLAKLSRVKLGPVAGVRVTTSPGDRATSPYYYDSQQQDNEPSEHKRLESSRFQAIPVRVVLMVRFDAAPGSAEGGRASTR